MKLIYLFYFSRYPNLNVRSVLPIQVCSLLDTDDPESIKQSAVQPEIDVPKKRRRRGKFNDIILSFIRFLIYIVIILLDSVIFNVN